MTDSETVLVPGARDVRGSLDSPDADACVVACPPHPQHGGSRSNPLLRRVGEALGPRIGCLRFDYGPWDEGRGERTDCANALAWARDRFDRVGLFGYSFGGAVAVLVAADESEPRHGPSSTSAPDALSVLAPAAQVPDGSAVVDAMPSVDCPAQVVYGRRDTTADWEPVIERARQLGWRVDDLPADHFFAGQAPTVADRVSAFFAGHLP